MHHETGLGDIGTVPFAYRGAARVLERRPATGLAYVVQFAGRLAAFWPSD